MLGYSATVSLNIDVSTEDKKLMPQIYALASRFEAETTEVNVHGTHPYVSDQRKKENFMKLFENTMEDAYFKAELYAKGCRRTLGPVMVMSDRPTLPWRWRCRSARGRSYPRQFICSSGWTEPNE